MAGETQRRGERKSRLNFSIRVRDAVVKAKCRGGKVDGKGKSGKEGEGDAGGR